MAYADRIAEVEKALHVIEVLRQYRPQVTPRDTPKSGARTPVFASWGFNADLSVYQHRKALSGALKQVSRNTPLRIRDDKDYDADGDLSDADRTKAVAREQEKMKRRSRPRPSSQELNRLSWTGSIDLNVSPESRTPSRNGHPEEFEMMPPLTHVVSPGQVTYNSAPVEPSQLNPNRYMPMTPSEERPGMDFDDDEPRKPKVIKQAAKVVKNAILHDARNIRGANDSETASLAWNVNSAHEAKVRSLQRCCLVYCHS